MGEVLDKKGRLEILDYSIKEDMIEVCVYDIYLDIAVYVEFLIDDSGFIFPFDDAVSVDLHLNEYDENYMNYIGGYYPDYNQKIGGRTDIENICIEFLLDKGVISESDGGYKLKSKVSDSVDEFAPKKIKDLKKGDFFTLKPIEYPKENQVWIRGDFERIGRKYSCINYADMNYERFFSGDKEVYLDFEF